jgi:hypothetical protein
LLDIDPTAQRQPPIMSNNTIKVVARFRPQNRVEIESGGKPIVAFASEDTCSLDVWLSST